MCRVFLCCPARTGRRSRPTPPRAKKRSRLPASDRHIPHRSYILDELWRFYPLPKGGYGSHTRPTRGNQSAPKAEAWRSKRSAAAGRPARLPSSDQLPASWPRRKIFARAQREKRNPAPSALRGPASPGNPLRQPPGSRARSVADCARPS